MTKEELEKNLNKEYKSVGTITIREMHEEELKADEIMYVSDIMSNKFVKPLKSDEPIIVSRTWGEVKLIDGYHRLKYKLQNNEKVKAIVLDSFSINRKEDSFLNFMKSLIKKTVKFVDDNNLLVGKKLYHIAENGGCGGCGNGWSSIEVISDFINKPIKVSSVKEVAGKYEDLYDLYINDELVAKVDTGWGNGYYGGDFEVKLIN